MNRVAKFSKVSYERYLEDLLRLFPDTDVSSEEVLRTIHEQYDALQLPTRATKYSAGYDFHSPIPFTINPGEKVCIPSAVRCQMNEEYVLLIAPRSSLGFKHHIMLVNTLGVIDCDFFYAENEGHIMIKLVNHGDHAVEIKSGERLVQGIFVQYGITFDDEAVDSRVGGIGSTDK